MTIDNLAQLQIIGKHFFADPSVAGPWRGGAERASRAEPPVSREGGSRRRRSPAPRTRRAISESVLSDSKGLRRHFRVAGLPSPFPLAGEGGRAIARRDVRSSERPTARPDEGSRRESRSRGSVNHKYIRAWRLPRSQSEQCAFGRTPHAAGYRPPPSPAREEWEPDYRPSTTMKNHMIHTCVNWVSLAAGG